MEEKIGINILKIESQSEYNRKQWKAKHVLPPQWFGAETTVPSFAIFLSSLTRSLNSRNDSDIAWEHGTGNLKHPSHDDT